MARLLDVAAITPSAEEVASHIRIRTRDEDGHELGTFAATTRPTLEEADAIALRAARYVVLRVGRPSVDPADLLESARDVAGLYAALTIETSFYGEGSAPDEGLSDQLGRMAREQLKALVIAARNNDTGGTRIHSIVQTTEAALDAALPTPYATGLDDLLPDQIA